MRFHALTCCTICGSSHSDFLLRRNQCDLRHAVELRRCQRCKGVFLAQRSESYDQSLYEYYAEYKGFGYSKLFDPRTQTSYSEVVKLMQSYVSLDTVLDVGCGKGDFVFAGIRLGIRVQGIELSKSAVDIAHDCNLPVRQIDFFDPSLRPDTFDAVTFFEVIEHVPNPTAFLKRAESLVKPGGLIYVTTPNFDSLDRYLLKSRWSVIHPEHLTYFTRKTLVSAIVRDTSLEVLRAETRNISLELLKRIFSLFSFASFGHVSLKENQPLVRPSVDIRKIISSSRLLSLLKFLSNILINRLAIGSTIVVLLRRPKSR